MKKSSILIIVLAFAVLSGFSIYAYDDPDTPSIQDKAKASIQNCRAFAAGFQSQGTLEDRRDFQSRFGSPVEINAPLDVDDDSVADYTFDAFTTITLDCADNKCRCRCRPKY
jgi:hypothetical protein